jgi:hypothetical protein
MQAVIVSLEALTISDVEFIFKWKVFNTQEILFWVCLCCAEWYHRREDIHWKEKNEWSNRERSDR